MEKYLTEINYDKLIEKALKQVVVEALKIVEKQGLPGDHHFYIAFRTDHPGVKMDEVLKNRYPREMTIVLQNQFSDLMVGRRSRTMPTLFPSMLSGKKAMPKRSVVIAGRHNTSISLENEFLEELDDICRERQMSFNALITEIDAGREENINLSAAARIYVLQHLKSKIIT